MPKLTSAIDANSPAFRTLDAHNRRLQLEARALAVEQVETLEKLLLEASALSREIAEGGDAYPVGAREIASRLAADLPTRVETMKQIIGRMPVK